MVHALPGRVMPGAAIAGRQVAILFLRIMARALQAPLMRGLAIVARLKPTSLRAMDRVPRGRAMPGRAIARSSETQSEDYVTEVR